MSKISGVVAAVAAVMLTTQVASADDDAPKSRDTAAVLSAGGTALSIGLVATGAATHDSALVIAGLVSSLVTPSAGEIYAGQPVTWGMGVRVASVGVGIAGLSVELKCVILLGTCHEDLGLAGTLIVVGALGYAGGTLYDIAAAGSAVDDYNQRHHLRIAPTVVPTASGGPAVGVGIGGTF